MLVLTHSTYCTLPPARAQQEEGQPAPVPSGLPQQARDVAAAGQRTIICFPAPPGLCQTHAAAQVLLRCPRHRGFAGFEETPAAQVSPGRPRTGNACREPFKKGAQREGATNARAPKQCCPRGITIERGTTTVGVQKLALALTPVVVQTSPVAAPGACTRSCASGPPKGAGP